MDKNLWNEWEKLVLRVSKILAQNSPQTPKYIGCQKLAVGALSELPVDRRGRPPMVGFLTVGATVDRLGRPTHWS